MPLVREGPAGGMCHVSLTAPDWLTALVRAFTALCTMTSIVADVLEIPGWIVAGVVALLHVYFLALEMFMWRGRARRVFGTKRAIAEVTANMAANQVCSVYQALHVCSLAVWHGAGCG